MVHLLVEQDSLISENHNKNGTEEAVAHIFRYVTKEVPPKKAVGADWPEISGRLSCSATVSTEHGTQSRGEADRGTEPELTERKNRCTDARFVGLNESCKLYLKNIGDHPHYHSEPYPEYSG